MVMTKSQDKDFEILIIPNTVEQFADHYKDSGSE
jgi:hypothetical protein